MDFSQFLVLEKVLPPQKATFKEFNFKNSLISNFLKKNRLKLYAHQAEALKKIEEGKNLVITTPTASGKSLIYILSIFERWYKNPETRALVIFPLKALAQDQYQKIKEFALEIGLDISVDVYDGDTPQDKRRQIKANPPNILITTPDMLSAGILPYHYQWNAFFENLDFVVIDEVHSYRGILGSHVANIIKRLKRVVDFYKSRQPTFITNSATIHNPSGFVEKLIDEKVVEISKSGAPSPKKIVQIFKKLPKTLTVEYIANNVINDISTIVFTDSRKEAELLTLMVREKLKDKGREDLLNAVSPYRSGYTPEERREIEFKTATRNVRALISTSALEMGIDIGDLESCVILGYPGTLAQLWQRFGRAGRRDKTAYNVFIPGYNALDQYFVKNPEEIFNRNVEEPVINPKNKFILEKHLPAMASELPIDVNTLSEEEKEVARKLYKEGVLTFSRGKLYAKRQKPFSIRSSGESYLIKDVENKKMIGDISEELLVHEAHPGAIYLHKGEKFVVKEIDHENRIVWVNKTDIPTITEPIKETTIDVLNVAETKELGNIKIYKGTVNVQTLVRGYTIKDIEKNKKVDEVFFDDENILKKDFQTVAFWFTVPEKWEERIIKLSLIYNGRLLKKILREKSKEHSGFFTYEDIAISYLNDFIHKENWERLDLFVKATEPFLSRLHERERLEIKDLISKIKHYKTAFVGALHGVEHSLIGIYPLFVMNDRWDIGGLSTNFSPFTGQPTIFIYDGYEGGVGYSEVGYNNLPKMMQSVYKSISTCSCLTGCPSCIYSPKCGNANDYLDKAGTLFLAKKLLKELTS